MANAGRHTAANVSAVITNSDTGSFRELLLRLWRHASARRRRQFVLVVGFMVFGAAAEVISLGAVLPFLGVLTAPEKALRYPGFAHLAQWWGIDSADQLLLPFTLVFVAAAVLAGSIRLLLFWVSTRFAYAAGADFSIDVYRRTLYQPYPVHIERNSSEVISGTTVKVSDTITALNLLLLLFTSLLILVTVTLALFAIDPLAAGVATLGFGGSYGLIRWGGRRRLYLNSQRVAREQTAVVKALQEGLGGIRDVLLDGTQAVYCDIYGGADNSLRRAQSSSAFIAGSPRFAMEALGMVLIAALAYGLSRQPGGVASTLPVLGALALGAQRLLPALQQAYTAWSGIAACHASVAATLDLLDQPLPPEASLPPPPPLPLRKSIRFNGIRFRYRSDGPWVLDGIDVTIPKGARVGFVGSTGSGKSTALDVMLGLLTPIEGELLVDDQPISGTRVRTWQRAIAHVPQNIYLADATLAENIAFGVHRGAIDRDRVRYAARQAQIADFIEGRPGGYDALAGERGVRLSGGQRQRIGIARALYKQASVLVFDEATSALDTATEQSVMDAIAGLDSNLTIVLIAHRITTVRRCDTIIQMENGRVVAQGTFEQLLERSPSFRNMVKVVA